MTAVDQEFLIKVLRPFIVSQSTIKIIRLHAGMRIVHKLMYLLLVTEYTTFIIFSLL